MKYLLATTLFFLLTCFHVAAQTISIQGVLRDPNGRSVEDGFYNVVFKIYDVEAEGMALWEDTYEDLETRHGVFQANLGDQTTLDGLAFDTQYFVGVTVENYNEITPRIPITIYPYAKAILGQDNLFPSTGNVELYRDSIIVHQGALRLMGADGVIMFNDGTTLNTAEFGGPAASLLNTSSIVVNADKDTLGAGNINFQIAGATVAQVNNSGNVGIGVTDPESVLHLKYGSDANAASGGTLIIGELDETNIGFDNNEIQTRNNGVASNLHVNSEGGEVTIGNSSTVKTYFKVGDQDAGEEGYVQIYGAGAGIDEGGELRIYSAADHDDEVNYWWSDAFEDDYRIGSSGSVGFELLRLTREETVGIGVTAPSAKLHIAGGSDVTLADGGFLMTGNIDGTNIVMDNNEIQSRDNGAGANLLINVEGGNVRIGGADPDNSYLSVGAEDEGGIGYLELFGEETGTEGGEIRLYAAAEHDASNDYFYVDAYQDDFRIGNVGTGGGVAVLVNNEGNVGIGDSSPNEARLVVRGSELDNLGGYGYLNSGGNTGTIGSSDESYSIYASDRIAASEFNAHSDKRIKHVLSVSDSKADIETLKKIKITDYEFVDKIAKGDKVYKKVIAQEVKAVYPQAVSVTSDFIPSVYELSEKVTHSNGTLAIRTEGEHGFEAGDFVRIVVEDKILETEVLKTKGKHQFTVGADQAHAKVFVYGKKVDDFHTVDYEAISMLNVSATQELIRQVEEQQSEIDVLKAENQKLKAQLTKIDQLEAKLNLLLNVDNGASSNGLVGKE